MATLSNYSYSFLLIFPIYMECQIFEDDGASPPTVEEADFIQKPFRHL